MSSMLATTSSWRSTWTAPARSGRPARRVPHLHQAPSMAELERRLRTRATESEEQIRRRLATATVEMAAEPEFDETVLNDELETAAKEVASAIARLRGGGPSPLP